jgi:ABC-2 type transport system permease protein
MNWIHVIRREYIDHVKKRSFVIGTILAPVFMMVLMVVPIVLSFLEPDDQMTVAVVDYTGEVGAPFVESFDDTTKAGAPKYVFRAEPADVGRTGELIASLEGDDLDIVVIIPADVFESGSVEYLTREVRNFQVFEDFENRLTEAVIKRRLAREGLDYEKVTSLTTSITLDVRQITGSGELEDKSILAEWGVVFVFVMILYMALLSWGIAISRSIIEEKSSRIVEVLLSSVEPKDMLLGKVVGIGLAGFTQMTIWAVVGLAVTAAGGTTTISVFENISVPAHVFFYFVLYFMLGFLFYAALFTVIGAICSSEQDAQQLQGLVTMPMLIPILVLMFIVQSPNSTVSVVLSLIPFFTPMVMLGRIIVLQPSAWQIWLSMGLMLVSIYFMVSFAARVFRVGLLMYGKRPSLPEVFRWYRSAG